MRGESMLSASDVALLSGNNRNNDGFGDNSWWIIVLLLFGWGRNGFGNGFGGNDSSIPYFQSLDTDFATLERKLDSISNGICDSTFALNNTIVNGFSNTQQTLCQGFNGVNTAILQGNYAISSQLADCCCATQRAIDGLNYNMATNSCAITNAINSATRDIVDSQNANTRAILDAIAQSKVDAMQDKIATLTAQNQSLQFAASQAAQNDYLTNALRPCPVPAYVVANPYCNCGQQIYGCGC